MPFSALYLPSLALTQLKRVLDDTFESEVVTTIHYLNHDFGDLLGVQQYQDIADGDVHLYSGLGEWFFRSVAFPEAADNADAYFRRFYRQRPGAPGDFKRDILQKRAQVDRLLDDIIERDRLDEADIVGFTSMFAQNVASFALARKLKARSPRSIIVMGGANCEAPMGPSILEHVPWVDLIFSGPALKSFPEFVRRRLRDDPTDRPLNGVFRRWLVDDGTSTVRADAQPVSDIGDELDINEPVLLDYDDFLNKLEERWPDGRVRPRLLFETSRGCWWGQKAHCTFCGLNGSTMSYRAMTPDHALAQFDRLFRYANRCKWLFCVDNIVPQNHLTDVFPRLRTPETMSFYYCVKADLSEEDVAALASARVLVIQPGVEALATSTLRLMRKGTSAFTNLRLFSYCALHGVAPSWNLLVGFPNEPGSVFEKYCADIPKLIHFAPPTGVFPIRFDRFSPYFDQAASFGLRLRPLDMYSYAYALSDEAIAGFAYYFADDNFGASYQADMATWIADMRTAVAKWMSRYSGADGGLPAELSMTSDMEIPAVYDSRSGKVQHVLLSPDANELLRLLQTPRRAGELNAALPHLSVARLSSALEFLRESQLLFEEGDRIISLVLPRASHRLATAQRPQWAPAAAL
jgi:magnesium-protoporphyrin IX monomethyl ester (oxidative) cyclase